MPQTVFKNCNSQKRNPFPHPATAPRSRQVTSSTPNRSNRQSLLVVNLPTQPALTASSSLARILIRPLTIIRTAPAERTQQQTIARVEALSFMRLCAFSLRAEEFGLLGSYEIAHDYARRGVSVVSYLNLDQSGYIARGTKPVIRIMIMSLPMPPNNHRCCHRLHGSSRHRRPNLWLRMYR
ncbi:hypothetical protein BC830DRAFT_263939 [Chytriomyces sp. MP71]|nr:hypothetical protein BC830DRAFT_263939 [Chytriomyces sp. MP71]